MDANALTPRSLFDGNVCYQIPPFQRPYVWTEEDQWQPLWEDVERVVDASLDALESGSTTSKPTHFLGAVVLAHVDASAGDPTAWSVIDGQQRLTTLQLLLDAAQLVLEEHGFDEDAETLQEMVSNGAKRFRGTERRFKLWPSRIDRAVFERVMDNDLEPSAGIADSRIGSAHEFFRTSITNWANVTGDPDKVALRLNALAGVLQDQLQVVTINLDQDDDDQLIFETLNDRGTPLLAADLIKNHIFQRCERLGVDVDKWNEKYWQDFDDDWWRGQVQQGRLYRSRIDSFLQYWLTIRLLDEISSDAVFARFRSYSESLLSEPATAEQFLRELRNDADTFRDFAQLDASTVTGAFYSKVIESLELGTFIPVLLWLISENHGVPVDQVHVALTAIESWAVRRTLLRRTTKDVNKMVIVLLRDLDRRPAADVGDRTVAFLLEQDSEARAWPTDAELRHEFPSAKVYGNIKQSRLRVFMEAIELLRRNEMHEQVTLPAKLELEHVMPQGWRAHWGEGVIGDPELEARRNHLINTIGNLTLVTKKLNSTLSHRPWTDEEALVVAPKGKDAGRGKRSLLNDFSLLVLNKEIVEPHVEGWSEDDIVERGHRLTESLIQIWPRG